MIARYNPVVFPIIQRVVARVPKGQVATYGTIARLAGFPGAARQVAWALRAAKGNRLPWHRILAAGGKISLPGEAGLEQRIRLEAEGVRFRNGKVIMADHEFGVKL